MNSGVKTAGLYETVQILERINMFTGIVEEKATVENVEKAGEGKRVLLKSNAFSDVSEGDSISVSGTCLTVENVKRNEAEFFLAKETLERTWFNSMDKGDTLNIETSLTPEDTMDGHIVQGHVDSTAEITEIEELEEGWNITFSKPEKLENYIVEKGFIAVEGISLTVTEENDVRFSVTIIPETWKRTNLTRKTEGSKVNIEADLTAKYLEKIHA